jgi:hypothetical protein
LTRLREARCLLRRSSRFGCEGWIGGRSKGGASAAVALVLASVFLCPAGSIPALAGETPMVAGGGRFVVNAMEYPWSAIGRLNVAGRAFCTGFLIGESTVLTAAHCLHDFAFSRWRSPTELHFVAGYQRDQSLISSPVSHYVLADDFEMSRKAEPLKAGADWAVVRLARPIGREAGFLGLERLDHQGLARLQDEGAAFVQAGYRGDWPHVITIDADCEILGFLEGTPSVAHDCDAVRGDSGSPILVFSGGEFRVVALVSMQVEFKPSAKIEGDLARISGIALSSWALSDRRRRPEAVASLARTGAIWTSGQAPLHGGKAASAPVQTIQTLLRYIGIVEADPSGNDTAAMAQAVRKYQRQNGLAVNGQNSLELLGHILGNLRS